MRGEFCFHGKPHKWVFLRQVKRRTYISCGIQAGKYGVATMDVFFCEHCLKQHEEYAR